MIWFVCSITILIYLIGLGKDKQIKHLEMCRSYVVEKLEATEEELVNALHRIEDLELDLECEKLRNKN
ncbi:hypothetical protein QEP13_07270 [Enterobacter ludwigii]|uniref:Uncharacterized protein n=1 Tax=Enterobacter cloacae TaxID=550 RepID=A0A4Q2DZM3_ENTCL|nr:hypothetical protein [Enterobacter cloacae]RXW26037.1 hypothetical protein DM877_26570 [Enterobacter cloacae]